jgi:TnpA family transposase
MIFAVTHSLGISFAPRIKKFKDQQLYSFESPSVLKNLGYKVLPKKRINTKIIHEQWDNILRFIATIKLKETTASQLFKRLSSYSRQHPLYRALKQFGRIVKTIFLLKYIDDVELRQMIEKQLNKLESSNKFGKAVFHGNNQEFQYSTKDEQLIADGCKRLIENAIICWNYMYLSQKVHDTKLDAERKNLIKTIKNGSVVAWQHINLQGEYDFSEEVLKDSIDFRLPELLELQVA